MSLSLSYSVDVFEGCHICPQYNRGQEIDIQGRHELRVGKNGYNKDASLEEIIKEIAIPNEAHIIVKKSPNSKWYVKRIDIDKALEIIHNKTTNYISHCGAKTFIIRY
jgi:hypothetical protein